jgi:hypothetical protein
MHFSMDSAAPAKTYDGLQTPRRELYLLPKGFGISTRSFGEYQDVGAGIFFDRFAARHPAILS